MNVIGTTSSGFDCSRLRDTFEEAEQDANYFGRCGHPCQIFELSVVATHVKKIPWERVVSE